jgi:hypothetical protein
MHLSGAVVYNGHVSEADKEMRRRLIEVRVGGWDLLAEKFGLSEGEYKCITVNNTWVERGLFEGDAILFAEGREAEAGDVVLIEEGGKMKLGLLSSPSYLDTPYGVRPLEETERIVAVGLALIRKLKN